MDQTTTTITTPIQIELKSKMKNNAIKKVISKLNSNSIKII
jgi:hypothetical protein